MMLRLIGGRLSFSVSASPKVVFFAKQRRHQNNYDVRRYFNHIRNIGVVAHIDAGKTTTSEQMLFVSGETNSVGRVDSGDTIMDFLPQERERGITISSAAISFKWKNYDINLIDTPGHVDFTIEVERSARVLDGAIVIIDAVSGVQSQTRTVWKQTQKQGIPAVAFINKMDRTGASFERAISSLKEKLGANAIPIQYPIGSEETFTGVIDLISLNKIVWESGSSPTSSSRTPRRPTVEALSDTDILYSEAAAARRTMIESIAELDDDLMTKYLEYGADDKTETMASITISDILTAIRRVCIKNLMVPAVCGASLRGKGVEPLLDTAVTFLPSPLDRPSTVAINKTTGQTKILTPKSSELCALAFKVTHDPSRGSLIFVRIYSGILNSKQVVYNSTRGIKERVNQVLLVSADDLTPIDSLAAGQVGCLVGLSKTFTGDTLVVDKGPLHSFVLDGLSIPKAVYSLAIEPEKSSQQAELEAALAILMAEDPSLRLEIDKESGQTMLCGLGELHLEIACDKLKRQFNVEVTIGKAYVAYRESLSSDIKLEKTQVYDRTIGTKRMFASLTVEIHPMKNVIDECVVELGELAKQDLSNEESISLLDGFKGALSKGSMGFPVIGLKFVVKQVGRDQDTTVGSLRACSSVFVRNLLREGNHLLLEPIMLVEIEVPIQYVGDVLSDLTVQRRAMVRDVATVESSSSSSSSSVQAVKQIITAHVPLATMLGYATKIRSMTQGEAIFSLEYHTHIEVDPALLVQK